MSEFQVRTNLPTRGVERPEIEDDDQPWNCQLVSHDGIAFGYCAGRRRYVASWTARDQWRTRRKLGLCRTHGEQFANAHGLRLLDVAATAAHAAAAAPAVLEPEIPDAPAADQDAPYERVRGDA